METQNRVLVIANEKGGVGKTTTAVQLAAGLKADGRRVLLIDLDPQESLRSSLGVDVPANSLGMRDVIEGRVGLGDVILDVGGLFFAPAGAKLKVAELVLSLETEGEPMMRLRNAIEEMKAKFDLIVVDTAPSLGLLTLTALAAADVTLIPVTPEFLPLERVGATLDHLKNIRKRSGRKIDVLGILPTRVKKNVRLHQDVQAEILSKWGNDYRVLPAVPETIRLAETPMGATNIFEYDRDSGAAQAYMVLVEEVQRWLAA